MSLLGLTDPWVIGAYAGCFITIAFCVVYSLIKGKDTDQEDESDD